MYVNILPIQKKLFVDILKNNVTRPKTCKQNQKQPSVTSYSRELPGSGGLQSPPPAALQRFSRAERNLPKISALSCSPLSWKPPHPPVTPLLHGGALPCLLRTLPPFPPAWVWVGV